MSLLQRLTRRLTSAPAIDQLRWVVLDVESTGLDPGVDRLLAIAAVALHTGGNRACIHIGDSFEVVLRHDAGTIDKPNIMLHGIGVGAQRQGVEPAQALAQFERYVANSPLIAFHAAFDQAMILRGFDREKLARPSNPWLDLEPLAAVLRPDLKARSLDQWMAHLNISCSVRHQAAADTLATAELLLKLWPAALREMGGKADFSAARKLAAQRRWLP